MVAMLLIYLGRLQTEVAVVPLPPKKVLIPLVYFRDFSRQTMAKILLQAKHLGKKVLPTLEFGPMSNVSRIHPYVRSLCKMPMANSGK